MNAIQRICITFYAVCTVLWAALFFQDITSGFYNYLYSFLFGLIPLFGGIVAMLRSDIWGRFKSAVGKAVFFTGLGVFCWGVGELIWSYYNLVLNVAAPYPSLADIGFAPSIFFYSLGAYYLSKAAGAQFGLRHPLAKVFVAVTPLVVFAFSWWMLIMVARGGVLVPEGEPLLKAILDIMYPLGDFVGLAIAIIVSGLSFRYLGGRYMWDIIAIFLGLFFMYVGDTIFSYTTTVGTFYNGQFGDLMLSTGTFLLTYGALGFSTVKVGFENIQALGAVTTERIKTVLDNVVAKIIKEQELVIGPLAWAEAQKVQGLHIDKQRGEVGISNGDPKAVVDRLVAQYERLFGKASQEVCKEAAAPLIASLSPADVPSSLRTA
ncbi:hypothetical protein A2851_03225 [Candidatus Kaiserbacteria bacterium RIFCSPHIGHO2_01_FULL_53_29]|uniref:Uncharacterized protein n=1 Tax=Candidatus Kaiserbacteria bacterium RIFCSPHIGHO2_01_FULL_53_29 TaxID=1798480 RepID=A0A1F6CXJ1_9BACT|nr:MAG: hypothetical protein A2851_03225 [Candidatus Kaiserbacteria bacterium RIFCSPHIGHO2_01_FULL_53_29]